MTFLTLLLLIKIAVTGALIVIPFLLASKAKLEAATRLTGPSAGLFRLYGIAVLALLAGYTFGIPQAQAGVFPLGVVIMCLVSNGGAAAYLFATGAYKQRPLIPFFLLTIAIALAASLILQEQSLTRLL